MARAVLCLVTDRRRLAARLGCDEAAAARWLVTQVRAAARGGVDLVQLREPDLSAAAMLELARQVLNAVQGTRARVVVNDRVDVAIVAGAHGVHLKAASIAPSLVRALLPPGTLVGASVHDAARASSLALEVDYFIAGTVYDSRSKPRGWPTLGMSGLAAISRAAPGVPVLGIGGLDRRAARDLTRAGARGLAAIDAFIPAVEPGRFEESVHETVAALRLAFDSPEHVT